MMLLFVTEFGRKLCCLSVLWDIATGAKFRIQSRLFNAVNQDRTFDAISKELEIIEASFTFRGLHDPATQCRVQIGSLQALWKEYGDQELFDFYLRQGWNTEGRREPMMRMALGEVADRSEHPNVQPLWELRTDPEGRAYDKPVYRMISKKEYLDDFFQRGRLRISTLAACKWHEGLQGDKKEGDAAVWTELPDGTIIMTGYQEGADAYILCATKENTPVTRRDFHADGVGAILIKDPYKFGLAVGALIPYVTHGLAGLCDYRATRQHHLPNESASARLHATIDFENGIDLRRFRDVAPSGGVFLKEKDLYEHQQEFRFAWFIKGPISADHVFIECPAWVRDQYCERIDF